MSVVVFRQWIWMNDTFSSVARPPSNKLNAASGRELNYSSSLLAALIYKFTSSWIIHFLSRCTSGSVHVWGAGCVFRWVCDLARPYSQLFDGVRVCVWNSWIHGSVRLCLCGCLWFLAFVFWPSSTRYLVLAPSPLIRDPVPLYYSLAPSLFLCSL